MSTAQFSYEGQVFTFSGLHEKEHIIGCMERAGTFYESDVLEKLRGLLETREGVAVDAGAFIGTHAIFFARVLRLPVVAFEASPLHFEVLKKNVEANGANVKPINCALGAKLGSARIQDKQEGNAGATSISFCADGNIVVTTVDEHVKEDVAVLKIDVEGAEIAVLDGAKGTIRKSRPIVCVEVHGTLNLLKVIGRLRSYEIVDCLGFSPTYLLVPSAKKGRMLTNGLWLLRSFVPQNRRYRLTALARRAAVRH